MRLCYIDIETASDKPISAGMDTYSEAATVILMAWAFDGGPVQHWSLGDAEPKELTAAFLDVPNTRMVAHNAAFERTLLTRCPPPWLRTLAERGYVGDPQRWICTMAQALAHSLPPALDTLSTLFKLDADNAKQTKAGTDLIKVFCSNADKRVTLPQLIQARKADWADFVEYCRHDVLATRALHLKMPRWNYPNNAQEHALWALDQRANGLGVGIDMALVRAAQAAIAQESERLAAATAELTCGALSSTTQRDATLRHLSEVHGVDLPDLQVSTVERRLADGDLPQGVKDLLLLRIDASKASTAKYNALARSVGRGDRLRNTLQFCGASRTGRWAGRIFQPQNLPRPSMDADDIDRGVDALKAGVADVLYPSVMQLASDCLRSVIVAGNGKKLVVSDLSNIEGRVLAFLADEHWKLEAFRRFDRGEGADLYKLAYAKSFGVAAEKVTSGQRQIGKVQELALGYEGGVGAFVAFAKAYGIDLDHMAALSLPSAPTHLVDQSASALPWAKERGLTADLADKTWIACDVIKRAWREAHPQTVTLWHDVKNAVMHVIAQGTGSVTVGLLTVIFLRGWLLIRLPSGRYLSYPKAALTDGVITYQGTDPYSRKWTRLKTYSGKLVENITQAVARDVLAHAMPLLESKGYPLVLSVHDELLTEPPDDPRYSEAELSAVMSTAPPWAPGLPLAAKGYEAYRYKKD